MLFGNTSRVLKNVFVAEDLFRFRIAMPLGGSGPINIVAIVAIASVVVLLYAVVMLL